MATKRMTIERILCPTDFSDFSERAFRRAMGLARWFGSQVTVLHVVPFTSPEVMMAGAVGPGYGGVRSELLASRHREARVAMERFLAPHLTEGVPIDTKILEGQPWQLIEEMATELQADMVVMGTHGRSGWERLVLGSTTEKIVRRLSCPVLTVGPHEPATVGPLFHRILCAADLTDASEHTVDLAFSLAQERLSRITLLHVIEGREGETTAEAHLRGADAGSLARNAIDWGRQELGALATAAQGLCEVEERVEMGKPWREIIDVANEIHADLIVVGAHVAGAVARAFLGSTANQVLRHAPCPVLVTREPVPSQGRGDGDHLAEASL